jgi:phosphate transport system permease protein
MRSISRATIQKSKRRDRIARWVITLGGVTIIASVIAILFLILGVVWPLVRPARSELIAHAPLPATLAADKVLALGVELDSGQPQSLTAHLISSEGTVTFLALNQGLKVLHTERLQPPEGSKATRLRAVEKHEAADYSLLWSDGSMSLIRLGTSPQFDALGRRSLRYSVKELASMAAPEGTPPTSGLMRQSGETWTRVALLPNNRISVARRTIEQAGLSGEKTPKTSEATLEEDSPGRITAMTMNRAGNMLYAGTDRGGLLRWELDDEGNVASKEIIPAFHDKRPIASLALVFGDVSLAVGDAQGGLTTWFEVRGAVDQKLRLIHTLTSHNRPVRQILPSHRNKSLLSLGEGGTIHLDSMTSERHLLTLRAEGSQVVRQVGYAPRGNAAIALDSGNHLAVWQIDSPHPEVSLRTLFGKVFYEGYDRPSYAWQTTGSEDFEPKLSLVPLIFGTFKGTFYAMLFAVPLALFGAAYTSHFTTPAFQRLIKPVVEIMAAVPSVVLGFLAALWLAPILQHGIVAVFVSLVTIPLTFLVFMAVWQSLRQFDWAKRVETGYEFLAVIPVILLGASLAVWLAAPLESSLFGGNFRLWLYESLRMPYDQRNCILIAFGLGFAVIPIVFSISEDALSSVPHSMTAASMALGASRWQTLWRVILPSASPGIFAGVMIGFGRAVGETMIVLMATGNTPILDWSPLNGMRTLSANIAVEIPEAPVGGTLYRVLFLCAVILFLLTFALNTVAELVRQRLRKRYGRF